MELFARTAIAACSTSCWAVSIMFLFPLCVGGKAGIHW